MSQPAAFKRSSTINQNERQVTNPKDPKDSKSKKISKFSSSFIEFYLFFIILTFTLKQY
jgi:hypothetical protein